MRLSLWTLLILLVVTRSSFAEYSIMEIFNKFSSPRMISFSDHNEVFVAGGDDHKAHVYLNEGDDFRSLDFTLESSGDVDVADITENGKWILTTDEYGVVDIYKFNFKTHEYELYQSIPSSWTYSGAITDDHMWVVFGSYPSLYVYNFDGNQFILNQTIFLRKSIRSVSLTNDHQVLAAGTYNDVKIYEHDGTEFTLSQTINPGEYYFARVSVTEDHQYLTFTDYDLLFVYKNIDGSY